MPAAKVKCEIFIAQNMQWGFRIVRGSRITLAPGETYKLRGGVRRAVRELAAISNSNPETNFAALSPLQSACLIALDYEQARWNNRKFSGYGKIPTV